MTALAASALVALSGATIKGEKIHAPAKAEKIVCNAHKRPDAIPYRVQFAHLFIAREIETLSEPGEAASFEQKALSDHRMRDARFLIRETGPSLGLALRLDRLQRGSAETWLRFGSAVHLSARS